MTALAPRPETVIPSCFGCVTTSDECDDGTLAAGLVGLAAGFFGSLLFDLLSWFSLSLFLSSSSSSPPLPLPPVRISGASSLRACPTFLIALESPISYQSPSASSFKKRPPGSILRIDCTTCAAMCAFSNFLVVLAK